MVAGGWDENGDLLSSTEIMPSSGSSWAYAAALPSSRTGLRGTSLNNQIFMTGKLFIYLLLVKGCFNFMLTGGANGRSKLGGIIKYNAFADKWIPVGELKQARNVHATSVLPLSMVKGFCSR